MNNMPILKTDNPNLESMEVEGVIISPMVKELGAIVLSSINEEGKTIKICSIKQIESDNDNEYFVDTELHTFLFQDIGSAEEFIEHLPDMSAIELLFAMNASSSQAVEH
jgi:hypothetical protein